MQHQYRIQASQGLLQNQIQHAGCIRYQWNQSCKGDRHMLQVWRTHLLCECKSNGNNKFQNKSATQQMAKSIYTDKVCNNKTSNQMLSLGTLSFQMSQPIRSGKDMSVSIDAIQLFLGKLGETYSLQKKLETQHDREPSSEEPVNEVMQAVMTWQNDTIDQGLIL